jgi:hypothetical protein
VTLIVDQPPPVPQAHRRPVWEIVIEHVERRRDEGAYGSSPAVNLLIADMRGRDEVGRERYRTPLTSGNGRDHLIDALQEQLDACVYLANELDEHGVGPSTMITINLVPDGELRLHLLTVQQLFADQVRAAICLRTMIKERVA